jgi:hypothetical protein
LQKIRLFAVELIKELINGFSLCSVLAYQRAKRSGRPNKAHELNRIPDCTGGGYHLRPGATRLKAVIEPVQETKKTIGQIPHSLIEYGHVVQNPGFASEELTRETSRQLRRLSSQLHGHLYLVLLYDSTALLLGLPSRDKMLSASGSLIGLSNSVFSTDPIHIEHNDKRIRNLFDSLGISSNSL